LQKGEEINFHAHPILDKVRKECSLLTLSLELYLHVTCMCVSGLQQVHWEVSPVSVCAWIHSGPDGHR
jgi:hypothetical protein